MMACFVSHRMQRVHTESGVVMTLFWVQTPEGHHHLAATGFDGRGSGHFQYSSRPELADVAGDGIPELRCTNRGEVMAWLEGLGARQQATFTADPLPDVDLSTLPGGQAGDQVKRRGQKGTEEARVGKRRKAAPSGGEAYDATQTAVLPGTLNAHIGAGGRPVSLLVPPNVEALAAFESEPVLREWIRDKPDEELVAEFTQFAQDLSGLITDESAPASFEPTDDMGELQSRPRLSSAKALEILDRIAAHGQASLQLLEASNISPCIGRLRRHPTPAEVSKKADTIARQWHRAASETLAHAKLYLSS
mmetsp:Transcript_6514/g.18754  ORF Transcript_6514/g.18754 Transcript_6514/m.18754 type:complete len:306 (-) Transcript_6514:501-1418(-)